MFDCHSSGKNPLSVQAKNIYYLRIRVPAALQNSIKSCEIVQSLNTESRVDVIPLALKLAANFTANLRGLEAGRIQEINRCMIGYHQMICCFTLRYKSSRIGGLIAHEGSA
jgi:hypothetical protein